MGTTSLVIRLFSFAQKDTRMHINELVVDTGTDDGSRKCFFSRPVAKILTYLHTRMVGRGAIERLASGVLRNINRSLRLACLCCLPVRVIMGIKQGGWVAAQPSQQAGLS
jgi:hypothetical protein